MTKKFKFLFYIQIMLVYHFSNDTIVEGKEVRVKTEMKVKICS